MSLLLELVTEDLGQPAKWQGGEAWFLCPFHKDTDPSLAIRDDVYYCQGCGAKGGAKGWLKNHRKLSDEQIKSKMKELSASPPTKPTKNQQKKPPAIFDTLPPGHDFIYTYTDKHGNAVGYIWRKNELDKKIIKQYTAYMGKFKAQAMPEPRPLYKLHTLKDHSHIIVLEGENVVEALLSVNIKCGVTTWSGGSKAWHKVDWSPLKGKSVLLIADRDKTGRDAMVSIKGALAKYTGNIKTILPDGDDGWDLKDAVDDGWDAEAIRKWIITNLSSTSSDKRVDASTSVLVENDYFTMIGRDDDGVIFRIKKTSEIVQFKYSGFTHKDLNRLAPVQWWCRISEVPQAKVISSAMLQLFHDGIVRQAQELPRFDYSRIRGRGVSIDGDHNVYHLGDKLLVGDNFMHLSDTMNVLSNYYCDLSPISVDKTQRCDAMVLGEFVQAVAKYRWRTEFDAALFIGWIVASLIGGGLDWRAHIWMLAPATSGKSWLIREVIKKVHGDTLNVGGDLTHAAVARVIASDALPMIIEEAEPQKGGLIDSVMQLLRLTSDGISKRIRASSSDKGTVESTPRATVMMASINTPMMSVADRTRYVFIKLSSQGVKDWRSVSTRILNVCKNGYKIKNEIILSRMDIYEKISKTKAALTRLVTSTRQVDNLSQLLGGYAWMIRQDHNKVIKRFADDLNVTVQSNKTDSDEAMLQEILGLNIRTRDGDVSIASMLMRKGDDSEYDYHSVDYGVKWDKDGNMIVACRHPALIKALKGSRVENTDLMTALLHLPDVKQLSGQIRFRNLRLRGCVKIPITAYKDAIS